MRRAMAIGANKFRAPEAVWAFKVNVACRAGHAGPPGKMPGSTSGKMPDATGGRRQAPDGLTRLTVRDIGLPAGSSTGGGW